jgi:hypothetical protein
MHAVALIDATLALILLAAGLALRNCVLMGAAVLLGISAFYRHMDRDNRFAPRRRRARYCAPPRNGSGTSLLGGA